MAPLARSLSLCASSALLCLSVGCAQFSWSGQGPGSPGTRGMQAPDAPVSTARPLPNLDDGTAPKPFATAERERIATVQPWVEQTAAQYNLDPDLINAVIWVESRFVRRAKSPAGARGLMQLMPATANALARQLDRPTARVYDPQFNVTAGSYYLLQMLDRFDGDETLALAAYNAGAGNVNKWLREDGALPPRSLEYVEHVQRARRRFIAMRGNPVPADGQGTMLAADTSEQPRVPAPPPRMAKPTLPTQRRSMPEPEPKPEPEPEASNPLAPDPNVYRPTPPLEPPLEDTPYPPSEPKTVTDSSSDDEPVDISTKTTLPSVLD